MNTILIDSLQKAISDLGHNQLLMQKEINSLQNEIKLYKLYIDSLNNKLCTLDGSLKGG